MYLIIYFIYFEYNNTKISNLKKNNITKKIYGLLRIENIDYQVFMN